MGLNGKQNTATAEDGNVWAITPYPGYAGSPAAVTLSSTKVGVTLTSHHLDVSSARSHAEELQRRGV